MLYVTFFAAASLMKNRRNATETHLARTHSFLIVIPAYKEDSVIFDTTRSAVCQDYPDDYRHVVVVSDHQQPDTNARLGSLPITLLVPTFQKSSKGKALQYAMQQTARSYDFCVILDADNIVDKDFLRQLNEECNRGWRFIQCHRCSKNADGDVATLDSISEEINNAIFRRGHNRVGLSSALIGSGMCLDMQWFRTHIHQVQTAGEDRELEKMLLQERHHIHYAENILVRDEKVSTAEGFERQRQRWMSAQLQSLLSLLPGCPRALAKGNIDYLDKTFQQMLIPRSLLLLLLPVACLAVSCFVPEKALWWWGLFLLFCIALAAVVPPAWRNRKTFASLKRMPSLVWRMLKGLLRLDPHNRDFLHTTHHTTSA